MRGRHVLCILMIVALVDRSAVRGEVTIADPGRYVVDAAGIVDDVVQRRLEGILGELERKSTAQVKVLTVVSTEGEPLFNFVQRHAEAWKLGQKGKDNGVLIAVAVNDREARIQVGYGLEGVLPDSWCGSLIRHVLISNFKRQDYTRGILEGAAAVANKIAEAANTTLTGAPPVVDPSRRVRRVAPLCGAGIMPMLVLVLVLSSLARRRRYRRCWGGGVWEAIFWGSMMNRMMRGGRSHWGGGFGGGGFGGFGGGSFGGGGGFGGGGAGGRW